jgi:hypothetical protein
MKYAAAFVVLLAILSGAAQAREKKQSFIPLAKGNYWKYIINHGGRKIASKSEITHVEETGKVKVIVQGSDLGRRTVRWAVIGKHLIWKDKSGVHWKILKFDAKKGDTWTTSTTAVSESTGETWKVTVESKVTTEECVQTPAGRFRRCLRIEHIAKGGQRKASIITWWARGVGLVKLEGKTEGEDDLHLTLTSFKIGPGISDEKLKEMVEKSDVVALVAIPKKAVGQTTAKATLLGIYRGKPDAKDGCIEITKPEKDTKIEGMAEGDFVVFLKKKGDKYNLLYNPAWAGTGMLGRMAKLIKIPKPDTEKLKELAGKASTVATVEVVKLEERGSYSYYVAKVISALKGCEEGKHLDVLNLPGMNLKKGQKRILLLRETQEAGRKMMQALDVFIAVLEDSEELREALEEIIKASK